MIISDQEENGDGVDEDPDESEGDLDKEVG